MSRKQMNRVRREIKTTIALLGSATPDLEIEQIVEATIRRCPTLISELGRLLAIAAMNELSRKVLNRLHPTDITSPVVQLPLGLEMPACQEYIAIPKDPARLNGRCIYRNRLCCSPSDLRLHLAMRKIHMDGLQFRYKEIEAFLEALEDHLPPDRPNGSMVDVIAAAAEVASS